MAVEGWSSRLSAEFRTPSSVSILARGSSPPPTHRRGLGLEPIAGGEAAGAFGALLQPLRLDMYEAKEASPRGPCHKKARSVSPQAAFPQYRFRKTWPKLPRCNGKSDEPLHRSFSPLHLSVELSRRRASHSLPSLRREPEPPSRRKEGRAIVWQAQASGLLRAARTARVGHRFRGSCTGLFSHRIGIFAGAASKRLSVVAVVAAVVPVVVAVVTVRHGKHCYALV